MNVPKLVQAIPFNGTIQNCGCTIACSDNYEFVFCTLESLHILEPLVFSFSFDGCSPVAVHRAVIEAPESICQFDFGIDRNTMHMTLPRDEMYELMLDRTLSPAVSCAPSYKGFGEAAWSPLGIGSLGTCALAALTMDHRLIIYVKTDKNWVDVVEPSMIFYEYLKAKKYQMPWLSSTNKKQFKSPLLQELWLKSYATAAVKMTWSHMMGDENRKNSALCISSKSHEAFAILAVGMKNGCIVLWKVKSPMKSSEDIELGSVFDSNMGAISALHWLGIGNHAGNLMIGGKHGKICMYQISVIFKGETSSITANKLASLWEEEDNLEVFNIASNRISTDDFYIAAGKGNFVIAWEMHGTKVISRNHILGNFLQPLTGLVADKGSFIGSSGDGTLVRIYLTTDDAGLKISLNEILKHVQDKNRSYVGICCSPNNMLFCVVQTISCFFDHLAIREPINLLFVRNKSIDETVSEILTLTESSISFSYFNDILHYICYCWLEQRQLPDVFMPVLELGNTQLRMQTIPKLQLLRWLLRLVIFSEQDEGKADHCKSQMDMINALLTKHQLLHLLEKVNQENFLESNNHWIPVILLVCQWLNDFYNDLDAREKKLVDVVFGHALLATGQLRTAEYEETCRLCKQPIPLENIQFGKCSNGHAFGRCCLSLALCDQPTYKKCSNCTVLASNEACDLLQNPRCPFCSRIF